MIEIEQVPDRFRRRKEFRFAANEGRQCRSV